MFTAFFSVLWVLSCIPSRGAEDRGLDVVAAESLGKQARIGKQYALLIAIDRYTEWPGLKNPVADAQDIRNILREHYYIDEFIELHDANATRANIARTFTDLQGRLGVHDSLFIYYAGHGYVDPGSQQGFWIPVNAGLDGYEQNNWLANSAIRGYIANLKTIHVFLVSDACFSGDMLNTDRTRPAAIDNAYFRRAYTLVSRLVLTSGSNETVPDESEFSRALKMCLLKNTEVLLDPYAIYSDVRLAVSETTPLLGSLARASHQDGATFIFFRRPLQPAAQTALAPQPQPSQPAPPQAASAPRIAAPPVQPPPAPSDWTPARDFAFEHGEKGVTITKYKGTAKMVNIPAVIDGSPVVEIGDEAFVDCSNLSSLSIPISVTSIGSWAFSGCSGLSSLSIPNGGTISTVAKTLADIMNSYRNVEVFERRDWYNTMIWSIMQANPNFMGIFTLWKPNALDGFDADYANTPGTDSTGRYMSWYTRRTGSVEKRDLSQYELYNEILGNLDKNEPAFNNLYFANVNGERELIAHLSYPIVSDKEIVGRVGVMLHLADSSDITALYSNKETVSTVVKTLADIMNNSYRDIPASQRRDWYNTMIWSIMQANPNFVGIFTLWKPNALDGFDAEYSNTQGTDSTGRYMSWYTRRTGSVEKRALSQYELYNEIVANLDKIELVFNKPYFVNMNGKQTLVARLSYPIITNGQIVGCVGIMLDLTESSDAAIFY
jgi:hypothetical protein